MYVTMARAGQLPWGSPELTLSLSLCVFIFMNFLGGKTRALDPLELILQETN